MLNKFAAYPCNCCIAALPFYPLCSCSNSLFWSQVKALTFKRRSSKGKRSCPQSHSPAQSLGHCQTGQILCFAVFSPDLLCGAITAAHCRNCLLSPHVSWTIWAWPGSHCKAWHTEQYTETGPKRWQKVFRDQALLPPPWRVCFSGGIFLLPDVVAFYTGHKPGRNAPGCFPPPYVQVL